MNNLIVDTSPDSFHIANNNSNFDSEFNRTTNSYFDSEIDSENSTLFSSTVSPVKKVTRQQILQFWIGVGLSISSSLFIGASFIIKKKALIRLSEGGRRANQGGYGYLRDCLWWSGLLSMAVGEAANFMAYTFAPASLVSTLGVLSVLLTAILSSKFLNERLNFLGKIGCFLCAIGSTVIVLHAPMEKDIDSMEDLQSHLKNFVFVIYVIATVVLSVIFIYHFRPKLPETSTYTLLIWIGVCSMIGSLSVMSVKGLGLAFVETVTGGKNELTNWLTWFCLVTLVLCVSVQMNFLNKALDTFNTAVVTPIYYVFFTSCVIIASAILFDEFAHLPLTDWVGLACGFFTVLVAIAILNLCKNFDEFTLAHLAQKIDIVNAKEDTINNNNPVNVHVGSDPEPEERSSLIASPPVLIQPRLTLQNDLKADSRRETEDDEIFISVETTFGSPGLAEVNRDESLLSGSFSPRNTGTKSRHAPYTYGTTH